LTLRADDAIVVAPSARSTTYSGKRTRFSQTASTTRKTQMVRGRHNWAAALKYWWSTRRSNAADSVCSRRSMNKEPPSWLARRRTRTARKLLTRAGNTLSRNENANR